MRFVLALPNSTRASVIVETHRTLTPQHETDLRTAMFESSCPNGMLFDSKTCIALRDTFSDMGPESIQVDLKLNTPDVLRLVTGSTLDERVETWLALLSSSWQHALPPDTAVAGLMYDFVPAAVGTNIHIVGDRR